MRPLPPVLLIGGDSSERPPAGHQHTADVAMQHIGDGLQGIGYRTVRVASTDEGLARVESQSVFAAVVLDWDLADGKRCSRAGAVAIIDGIRARSRSLPIFLAVATTSPGAVPLSVAREVHGYLHPLNESPQSAAHRLDFAVRHYYAGLLPPYLRVLRRQIDDSPEAGNGHQAADAYGRHPVGAEFQRLFGEGLTRADIGTGAPELGNWLEHVGAPADSERRAARVFGADWTYFALGGSSGANRIVINAVVGYDEIVLSDRSNHRSVTHGFILAGARPVYLTPAYNGFGMVGPVSPWSLAPAHVRELIAHSPLAAGAAARQPSCAVLTNSTHDGLCCDVNRVVSTLGGAVPRFHFDEASFGYAHAHPIYGSRHAMGADPAAADGASILAVQSTHGILPALSMSAMIHVKTGGRAPVDARVFNQSFMMHGTTSPFHPIIASNDVATAMMEPPAGPTLLDEAIREAVAFRQAMAATRTRVIAGGGADAWFFDVFQAPQVRDPRTGDAVDFADVRPDLLATDPSCWTLQPGDAWHGFDAVDVEGDHVMLDPMKVTLVCPGLDARGELDARGIPACIVARFLAERRVHLARAGLYTALVPFAIGASRGRWGALLESLHAFKRFYDGGVTVGEALSGLAAAWPRYANLTLRTLCDSMHAAMRALDLPQLGRDAAGAEPQPVLTPAAAYQALVRGRTELVAPADAAGRIAAVMVVPTASAVPIAIPGERFGAAGAAGLRYLDALETFGRTFPGFEPDVFGVEYDDEHESRLRVVIEARASHRRAT